ncbi:MAG: transcription antitermination factor NusB [Fimbriimonadaceae bacterium]
MKTRSRRPARVAAMRALYESDVAGNSLQVSIDDAFEHEKLKPDQREYAEQIIRGVAASQSELQETIEPKLNDYTWERLAVIDRILMCIALWEMYESPSTPPKVAIDEAIEMAKKYSTENSARFVNGVLGAIFREKPVTIEKLELQKETLEEQPEEEPESLDSLVEEVEEEEIEPEEAEKIKRSGNWSVRVQE